MSQAFGDLLSQYRARKHGLSQTRLAHLAGYDPAVLVRMCQGKKDLTGPSGRDRILRIIDVLHSEGVLKTQVEANALLQAASMPPLFAGQPAEAALLAKLDGKQADSKPSSFIHKSNLPHPLTPLMGRDADVTEVKHWLAQPEARVLTLIGPPGVGKTRLALQVAAEIEASEVAGEIHFVALAPINAAEFVLPAIAQALGVIQSPSIPLIESVKTAIYNRRLLLVIDNFEHVLDAAPQIAELLASSPLLKVLTTSRVALRISGEHEYTVQPLAIQPATELLIQRAQAVKPSLALDANNMPVIHAICNRLDLLPLAIELAAARLKLFTPEALMARLEKMPLDVLTNGASDLPARQHTLRRTIDWSYGLLSADEQAVFRRLGVFAGGFTLASAEAVAGADWESLSSLLDKSLIQDAGEVNGEPRFTLLELLREYALEKLEACGEGEATRRRHAQFVIALAEAAEPHMLTGEQVRWTKRLNSDLGNIRAALRWAQDRNEYETTMRILGPTWRYWQTQALPPEGLAWILPALHDDPKIPAVVRAKAWHVAGALTNYSYNDCRAGKPLLDKGLALAEEAGDHDVISLTLNGAAASNGAYEEYLEWSKQLNARALKHTEGEVSYGRACALLFYPPLFCHEARGYQTGLEMTREAQQIFQAMGDHNWEMAAWVTVAKYAALLGNSQLNVQYLCNALQLAKQMGRDCFELSVVCRTLFALGICAGQHRQATMMARLYSAAAGGMLLMGQIIPDTDLPDVKQLYIEFTGETPVDAAFAEAWAEGRAMPLDQVIDYALEVADELLRLDEEQTASPPTA